MRKSRRNSIDQEEYNVGEHQEVEEKKHQEVEEKKHQEIVEDESDENSPKTFDRIRTRLVIFGFLVFLLLELITKKTNINSPSYYAGRFTNFTLDCFISFGNRVYYVFDVISSYCNVKDVAQGIYDLLWPIFFLAMSPYYTFKGFLTAAIDATIQQSWYTIVTGLIIIALILTIAEINTPGVFKPSSWIGQLSTIVIRSYRYFGRFISDLSSFYRILKFEKFIEALIIVCHPIYQIMIAPIVSTLKGYFDEVQKYRYGIIIIFGTGTLVLLAVYGFSYYLYDARK